MAGNCLGTTPNQGRLNYHLAQCYCADNEFCFAEVGLLIARFPYDDGLICRICKLGEAAINRGQKLVRDLPHADQFGRRHRRCHPA